MVNEIIDFLKSAFPPAVGVMLAGAIPVTELRAAIPLAISLGMAPAEAFLWAVIGNVLPIPVLLWLLPKIMRWFTGGTWLGRRLEWWVERTRKRSDAIQKYGALGLMIFTAVPLPTTGAWSACLAAVIFKIAFRPACAAISLGVVIAGLVIVLLSAGLIR